MFRAIKPQWLTNDLGIEVSSAGRNAMKYRDGDHVLMLYCETIASNEGHFGAAILLPRDAHWLPPYEHQPIDSIGRAVIEKNLLDAWAAVDYRVTIES
jgi:hypothetical protein